MADDKFIRDIQENLRKQQEKADLEVRNKLHEADVIKADGPAKWAELKEWLRVAVEQINPGITKTLAYHAEADVLSLARTDLSMRLEATFNHGSSRISINTQKPSQRNTIEFTPKVQQDSLDFVALEKTCGTVRANLQVFLDI